MTLLSKVAYVLILRDRSRSQRLTLFIYHFRDIRQYGAYGQARKIFENTELLERK